MRPHLHFVAEVRIWESPRLDESGLNCPLLSVSVLCCTSLTLLAAERARRRVGRACESHAHSTCCCCGRFRANAEGERFDCVAEARGGRLRALREAMSSASCSAVILECALLAMVLCGARRSRLIQCCDTRPRGSEASIESQEGPLSRLNSRALNRSSVEVHSGPRPLALTSESRCLLNRSRVSSV